MEQTIGKRIAACRKKQGLTQDALAEKLGVTAQAVSKWENDQSCPDITMIPRLARLFSITTDELLGVEKPPVYEAQLVEGEDPEEDSGNKWEMTWNSGKKNAVGFALWIVLAGALLLASNILGREAGAWDVLWPTGLFVFGVFWLWPKFSFLRLGFALFGGYFTLHELGFAPFEMGRGLVLPILLLLFGLSLLADALKKKEKRGFHITHNGKQVTRKSYDTQEDRFTCAVSFGELHQQVLITRLAGGSAQVSFGELELDLTGCDELAPGCELDVSCSFGELTLRVPRDLLVEQSVSTSFGSVDVKGRPVPDVSRSVVLNGSVSFGEISIEYV